MSKMSREELREFAVDAVRRFTVATLELSEAKAALDGEVTP